MDGCVLLGTSDCHNKVYALILGDTHRLKKKQNTLIMQRCGAPTYWGREYFRTRTTWSKAEAYTGACKYKDWSWVTFATNTLENRIWMSSLCNTEVVPLVVWLGWCYLLRELVFPWWKRNHQVSGRRQSNDVDYACKFSWACGRVR